MTASEPYIRTRSEVKRNKSAETLPKDRLLEIMTGLLQTNVDLGFLLKLDQGELETLVVCLRDRLTRA
jgi:hypothetical protein